MDTVIEYGKAKRRWQTATDGKGGMCPTTGGNDIETRVKSYPNLKLARGQMPHPSLKENTGTLSYMYTLINHLKNIASKFASSYTLALTAHSDSLSREMKSGVLSQPEMQWMSIPPSPVTTTKKNKYIYIYIYIYI